jgi:hypothetical protein
MMDEQGVGRRNVVAGVAAGAVAMLIGNAALAPDAEARQRKKPPLAFMVATLSAPLAPDATTFGLSFQAAVAHPTAGVSDESSGSVFIDSDATGDKAHAQLVAGLRNSAAATLATLGPIVPEDRIAVTLL